jgi:hypothetical protein
MPISRPLLIVLVAAVLALVGFYATQGMGGSADGESTPVAVQPPPADLAPEAAQKPKPEQASKTAARRRARAERLGMPLALARAIEGRKTVVLFFRGGGSADDRATGRAVAALRGQRGVVVFSDSIGKLGRYRAAVGELGISQAPAVVIVDRKRSARVVQGYVDPATLAQDVADSR